MKIRLYALIILLFLTAVFVMANWTLVSTPAPLSLLVQDVQAPLGAVLCGIIVILSILFVVFLAQIETAAVLENHSRSKELERLRKIVDSREEDRIHALEKRVDDNFERLFGLLDQVVREESLTDLRKAMEEKDRDDREASEAS